MAAKSAVVAPTIVTTESTSGESSGYMRPSRNTPAATIVAA